MTELALEIAPHLPRLRRYARSLLRDSVRADDLVQDTMVRALEKAHLYQHEHQFARLAGHHHAQRARQRDPALYARPDVRLGRGHRRAWPGGNPGGADRASRGSPSRRAPAAGAARSLLLHWLHGLKYEEIATEMKLPLGTVQSRISRARKALRAMIESPDSRLGLAPRHAAPSEVPGDAAWRVVEQREERVHGYRRA